MSSLNGAQTTIPRTKNGPSRFPIPEYPNKYRICINKKYNLSINSKYKPKLTNS